MAVMISRAGEACGTLRTEQRGLYTYFFGEVSGDDLSKVTAVYENGNVELGVPVPEQGRLILRRSIPTARLPGGSLREAFIAAPSDWKRWEGGLIGGISYPPCLQKEHVLRIPWKMGDEINPMEPLLLYQYVCQEGESYLELCLDKEGRPSLN